MNGAMSLVHLAQDARISTHTATFRVSKVMFVSPVGYM